MKTATRSGAAIATAAFALALSGASMMAPTAAAADEAKIHCAGANSCKGHGECKTASNDCAGMNSCKGQGFISLTKAECDAKGGTVMDS